MKRALIGGGGHTREVLCQMNVNLPIFVDDYYYILAMNHSHQMRIRIRLLGHL